MGKLIQHPDKDLARIKRETTAVAQIINKEMIELQKKFPDHYFELFFELQRLGKQKLYRIHIKTFNDIQEEEKTTTQMLLSFIHAQQKDLSEYHSLIGPITKLYNITRKGTQVKAAQELIERIIRWENGDQEQSLEATLNELFTIQIASNG